MRRHRPLTITALLCLAGAATACSGVNPTVSVSGDPRAEEAPTNIANFLAADEKGRFTTLLACAELTGAGAAVTGTGPVTLFAPTNEAFARAGVRCDPDAELDATTSEALFRTLAQHVVDHDVRFTQPEGYDPEKPPRLTVLVTNRPATVDSILTDASGTSLVVSPDKSVRTQAGSGNARIVESDVQAPNGMIQVIDSVITPPAKATFPPTTEAPKPFE